VFLLQRGELADAVGGRLAGDEVRNRISRRRAEMAAAASIALPEPILGDRVPVMIGSSGASDHELRGLPVSRGVYDGRVAVVRSLDAASSFRDGDVLVVPFSDVAWTPLFSRAGAIIAEAGGMLSHSAIVARELGIPAVVSVGDACALPDGTRVRVDGLEGRISRIDVS